MTDTQQTGSKAEALRYLTLNRQVWTPRVLQHDCSSRTLILSLQNAVTNTCVVTAPPSGQTVWLQQTQGEYMVFLSLSLLFIDDKRLKRVFPYTKCGKCDCAWLWATLVHIQTFDQTQTQLYCHSAIDMIWTNHNSLALVIAVYHQTEVKTE